MLGILGDIRLLESVQRRWARQIVYINHLGYEDRLKASGMFFIYRRLLQTGIIKYWKIFHGVADVGI